MSTLHFTLANQPTVAGRYEPVEFVFRRSGARVNNPFSDIQCHGEFTAPSGKQIRVEGFSDAEDGCLLRLRFTAQEEGTYQYAVYCTDAAGDAQWNVTRTGSKSGVHVKIARLDHAARIEELARMLGGSESTARKHAAELLAAG